MAVGQRVLILALIIFDETQSLRWDIDWLEKNEHTSVVTAKSFSFLVNNFTLTKTTLKAQCSKFRFGVRFIIDLETPSNLKLLQLVKSTCSSMASGKVAIRIPTAINTCPAARSEDHGTYCGVSEEPLWDQKQACDKVSRYVSLHFISTSDHCNCDIEVMSLNADYKNVALKRPIYSNARDKSTVVDGSDLGRCSLATEASWYVINLQRVHTVTHVEFTTRAVHGSARIPVFVTRVLRKFHPCRAWEMKEGALCGRRKPKSKRRKQRWKGADCAEVGQFVAVYFQNQDRRLRHKICQIKVFGKLLGSEKPFQVFPDLPEATIDECSLNLPLMRDRILRGIDKVKIAPYTSTILPLSEKSQPVLVNPENGRPVLVASTFGAGRVLVGGSAAQLLSMERSKTAFWRQAARWLVFGRNPRVFHAFQVKREASEKRDRVILWFEGWKVTRDQRKLIRKLVVEGRAGIFYAIRWTIGKKDDENGHPDLI